MWAGPANVLSPASAATAAPTAGDTFPSAAIGSASGAGLSSRDATAVTTTADGASHNAARRKPLDDADTTSKLLAC